MRDQIQQFTKNAADNYTETNDRIVDAVVETNRKVVEFAVKTADQVIEQLEQIDQLPQLSFADNVPTPAETGARYLEFVERAAELNREFAQRVAANLTVDDVVAPVAEKAEAVKTAAKKTTKKATAKKATAKKATAKKSTKKAQATKAASSK